MFCVSRDPCSTNHLPGKLDEIFGPLNAYFFSVKMAEGMKASSFKKDAQLFIDPYKTLAFDRFLPQKPGSGGKGRFSCFLVLLLSFSYRAARREDSAVIFGKELRATTSHKHIVRSQLLLKRTYQLWPFVALAI